MRYQVPQFIDIEDKIIGPLTLKQFIYYLVAVLLLVPVYLSASMSAFITIAVPTLGLAALLAHFRLNGKSLFIVAANIVGFALKSQVYIWRRTGTGTTLRYTTPSDEEALPETEEPSSLSSMLQQIETSGRIVDEDTKDPLTEQAPIEPA